MLSSVHLFLPLSPPFLCLPIQPLPLSPPRGFAPDPAGGAYSAPPDPLAVFKGPLRGGEGEEREEK